MFMAIQFVLLLYLFLVLMDVSITLHCLVDRHRSLRGTCCLPRIEEALLHWKWRHQVLPKPWYLSIKLHSSHPRRLCSDSVLCSQHIAWFHILRLLNSYTSVRDWHCCFEKVDDTDGFWMLNEQDFCISRL